MKKASEHMHRCMSGSKVWQAYWMWALTVTCQPFGGGEGCRGELKTTRSLHPPNQNACILRSRQWLADPQRQG